MLINILGFNNLKYLHLLNVDVKPFNNLICNNNSFWRDKFVRDYGSPEENVNVISWRAAYQNHNKVVGFGDNRF